MGRTQILVTGTCKHSVNPDPRLAAQDERIELLEVELQRLRDQADFTEKLLSERSGAQPEDAVEEDTED